MRRPGIRRGDRAKVRWPWSGAGPESREPGVLARGDDSRGRAGEEAAAHACGTCGHHGVKGPFHIRVSLYTLVFFRIFLSYNTARSARFWSAAHCAQHPAFIIHYAIRRASPPHYSFSDLFWKCFCIRFFNVLQRHSLKFPQTSCWLFPWGFTDFWLTVGNQNIFPNRFFLRTKVVLPLIQAPFYI